MKTQAKEKIKVLISSVLICLLAFLLMLIFIPKVLGYKTFYIKSQSMMPAIPQGSLAFVKETEFKNIKAGDVLTFKNDTGDEFFTHRVVSVDSANQMFTTKGDANKDNDPAPTSFYFAVGKVDFSIPLLGFVSEFVNSLTGKIIIGAVYIAWIAVEIEIFAVKRKASQED